MNIGSHLILFGVLIPHRQQNHERVSANHRKYRQRNHEVLSLNRLKNPVSENTPCPAYIPLRLAKSPRKKLSEAQPAGVDAACMSVGDFQLTSNRVTAIPGQSELET
jgi:hypothetical protein